MIPKLTKTLVKAAIKGCVIFEKSGEENLKRAYCARLPLDNSANSAFPEPMPRKDCG